MKVFNFVTTENGLGGGVGRVEGGGGAYLHIGCSYCLA